MHGVVDVGIELGDDAAGLGFDLDFGDGLDLAGGHDRAGDVAHFGGAQLGGIDGRRTAEALGCDEAAADEHADNDRKDDPKPLAGFRFRFQGASEAGKICSSEWSYAGWGSGGSLSQANGPNGGESGVLAEHAQDLALDADVAGGGVDGLHLAVGGLQADEVSFAIEALEGGVGAVDQGHDDLSLAGGAGALDQDVVAGDDVLVAHGVALDLEGIDLAAADDVAEGDGLGSFDGLDGLAGGDAAEQREAVHDLAGRALGDDVDGAAAIVGALQQALGLEIGDVLMDGGERAEAEARGDLLIGGGVAVAGGEAGEKVENLFLPTRDSHALILANKRRIAAKVSGYRTWYVEPERPGGGCLASRNV